MAICDVEISIAIQIDLGEEKRARESRRQVLRSLGYVEPDAEEGGVEEVSREDFALSGALAFQAPGVDVDELLAGCRLMPEETPRGMFFRCWGAHPFVDVSHEDNLSTFSVDVDTASYTLARRTLQAGRLPVPEQVRTEEFVNYFGADQPAPSSDPFALGLELAPSPFVPSDVELLRVTVRGKDIEPYARQPLALTFVVDTSGSMGDDERLEHVKEALGLLVQQLDANDSLALVAFSKEAQVVCPPTSAAARGPLEDALYALRPKGGTNVEAGLLTGYHLAAENLVAGAVNRVVFLSDGVGNIGETDQTRLLEKVAEYRATGLYLNTIGVGLTNHHDEFLEQLADKGDGVCNYVDSLEEARRVMVDDFTKTLQPIARDVKIQVDFDPDTVLRYRQLGYENRALLDEDFRDDAVDAGEVNAGHQVSALYEVVRVAGRRAARPLVTVRVRYKPPFAIDRGATDVRAEADAETGRELEASLRSDQMAPSFGAASWGFRRDTLAAQFAELLRWSIHARGDSLDGLVEEARKLVREHQDDPELAELLGLIETALPMLREKARSFEERPVWERLADQLRLLNYEAGRRERLRLEVDDETLEEEQRRRAELEMAIRELLQKPEAIDLKTKEVLKGLGYIDDGR